MRPRPRQQAGYDPATPGETQRKALRRLCQPSRAQLSRERERKGLGRFCWRRLQSRRRGRRCSKCVAQCASAWSAALFHCRTPVNVCSLEAGVRRWARFFRQKKSACAKGVVYPKQPTQKKRARAK
eukprot:15283064-Alexandrium_andersonii.AAC.1